MESDSIHDSTRYLVNGIHFGNIMPGNRAEMQRDVFLQKGAQIRGGLYANELSLKGSGISVEGAVYCKSSIKIDYSEGKPEGDVIFGSTVICPGTLLIQGSKIRTRFLSDIYFGKVNVKNCIIYGNIYASSANIEDSIVLGGIYCKKQLTLKNTIMFTFRANECELDEHVSILSPFGFAEKIKLYSSVNVLTFNNIFDKVQDDHPGGNIKLDETDIYEIELEQNGNDTDTGKKKIQVLSVAERLLNTKEIIDNFRQNRNFIEFLSLHSHLPEEDKKNFLHNNKDEIESEMWRIIDERSDFRELSGERSIEEMFNIYENQNREN